MAIDPKLLVIKPVDELEEETGLQEGDLLFYDGSGNLKRISIDTFNNLSKTATPLGISDTAPTVSGLYKPKTSGTYANAGGLVAQVGYDTLFFFNGTTWSKSEFAYPQATQFIQPFTGSTFPLVSTTANPIQRTHENSIWQLTPGQTATSSDVPGVSSKWVVIGSKVSTLFDPTTEVEAQGGKQINDWLLGYQDNLPVDFEIGTNNFNSTATPATANGNAFFYDNFPIPVDSKLKTIKVKAGFNTIVIIKRFKKSGNILTFQNHFGWNLTAGTNIIDVATRLTTAGGIANFIFDQNDIFALHFSGGGYVTTILDPLWGSIKYSPSYANGTGNVDLTTLSTTGAGANITIDLTFEEFNNIQPIWVEGVAKSDINNANDKDLINVEGLKKVISLNSEYLTHIYDLPKLTPPIGRRIFDIEKNSEFYFDGTKWKPSNGDNNMLTERLVFDWDFSNVGVSKSSNINIITETFTQGVSYQIRVGDKTNSDGFQFLKFDNVGQHLFEFGREVIEFTLDSFGTTATVTNRIFGSLYIGSTISRKVNPFGGINGNGTILRTWTDGNTYMDENIGYANTFTIGNKYRLEHVFYGGGRYAALFNITGGGKVFVTEIRNNFPTTSLPAYPCRPNNRFFGLGLNDIGVTVSKYQIYDSTAHNAELIVIGDSITSSRTATSYGNGFGKLITEYIGAGAYLVSGGSNTTEDIVNIIDDVKRYRPKTVVLAIGTNDCNLNKANRQTKYQEIITALQSVGSRIIISNVIPSNTMVNIVAFNAWIQNTFGSSIQVVDNFKALANAGGTAWNPIYKADDLHPNDLGHALMFEKIKPYL